MYQALRCKIFIIIFYWKGLGRLFPCSVCNNNNHSFRPPITSKTIWRLLLFAMHVDDNLPLQDTSSSLICFTYVIGTHHESSQAKPNMQNLMPNHMQIIKNFTKLTALIERKLLRNCPKHFYWIRNDLLKLVFEITRTLTVKHKFLALNR